MEYYEIEALWGSLGNDVLNRSSVNNLGQSYFCSLRLKWRTVESWESWLGLQIGDLLNFT